MHARMRQASLFTAVAITVAVALGGTAFAQAVGAGPTKQIVLVLDGAGWHDSPKVRVPEHVVARQEGLLPPARLQNGS